MALLLHVDWWGELAPMMILCVVIFFFGVAARRIAKKAGRGDEAVLRDGEPGPSRRRGGEGVGR